MLNIFSCIFWSSVCLLWRTVYLDLLPIFWWVFFCCCYWAADGVYKFEINHLSVASFANIFSNSVGCLFLLFRVSFTVQKLLSLIRSDLFIFVFIVITLGGGSEKILLWFMLESVWPMFSSKSLIASGLTFRSLIHLSLFLHMVLGSALIFFFYM